MRVGTPSTTPAAPSASSGAPGPIVRAGAAAFVSWRPGMTLCLAVCAVAVLVACGDKKAPQLQPTPTQVTPQIEPPPPPPLPPPIREVAPSSGRVSKVTVIDAGADESRPKTLIEASRLAKQRKREETRAPIAEINDDNLAEYAEGGDVIVLESAPAAPLEDDSDPYADPNVDPATGSDIRDEEFWRNRALELRMSWRRAIDEIAQLELQAAAMRQQFYAEEDPYIRDSQVKPAWDRTLDRLAALREQTSRYERELGTFLEEGRQAGALQGWLNQGWELEPTDEEKRMVEKLRLTEPGEPESREPEDVGGGDPTISGGN